MKITKTSLPEVLIVDPAVFSDNRGFFLETYHLRKYIDSGMPLEFVQDNHSHSRRSTLRGLHYQLRRPQGKLIYVVTGTIYDVAVDIRQGSPTFAHWAGLTLSADNKRQIYVPPGFAHGFFVLSDAADVIYKCTESYAPDDEYGIIWSDPTLSIDWPPTAPPILSTKDQRFPLLSEIPETNLPVFQDENAHPR
ncbi:MAG: dTDP-4-dehydrorhamnose 3,5-epimerase [Deltaproteobacteria bacterium]|nr:dTDP-4-dehydrorhamnose 3,5-epimerase [Deltaproteobacteria bacterium]